MEYLRAVERINAVLSRLKVPGGWIVIYSGENCAICFLPDPKNDWKLKEASSIEMIFYGGNYGNH